jgi:hypothetical protein
MTSRCHCIPSSRSQGNFGRPSPPVLGLRQSMCIVPPPAPRSACKHFKLTQLSSSKLAYIGDCHEVVKLGAANGSALVSFFVLAPDVALCVDGQFIPAAGA